MSAAEAIAKLQAATEAVHEASRAVFALAKAQALETERKAGDNDDWKRLVTKERCPVSGFSRSKIWSECAKGTIRSKMVSGTRYYSLADVRRLISDTTP